MTKRSDPREYEGTPFSLKVSPEQHEAIRLDRFLAEEAELAHRSALRKRITNLSCNGKSAKLSTRVRAGDRIAGVLLSAEPIGVDPEEIPLTIIYEDSNVLVIHKEQGTVVHPGAGNRSGTIANALAWRYGGNGFFAAEEGDLRPGIVHRLDKDTSGVMIVAKNAEIHSYLVEQFSSRRVEKQYLAIVKGRPRPSHGSIDLPVARDPHNRLRYSTATGSHGKPASTEYETLRNFRGYSLVRFSPKSGRTHQIRVHAVALGTPILGDPIYARRDPEYPEATLMLHAFSLEISIEPGGAPRRFRAPVSSRFHETISCLRQR